jgi:vacuolar-type H+-ATPase subunit E/Vma4
MLPDLLEDEKKILTDFEKRIYEKIKKVEKDANKKTNYPQI